MDFNLPPWLFTWAQLFFLAYVLLSVVPVAKFLYQKNNKQGAARPEVFLNLLGKVGLDIGLIMGVSGTAIAMMGSLVNYDPGTDAYFQATYIVGTILFGAVITGLSFCLTYPESNEHL